MDSKLNIENKTENFAHLKFFGFMNKNSLFSRARRALLTSTLLLGSLSYILEIYTKYEKLDFLIMMEIIHFNIVFIACSFCSVQLGIGIDGFIELDKIIQSGFFTYGATLSSEQIEIRSKAKRNANAAARYFTGVCFISLLITSVKEPLFFSKGKERPMVYHMWVPFTITTTTSYVVANCYLIYIGFTVTMCLCTFIITYVILAGHLCAQLQILQLSIEEIFIKPRIHQNFGLEITAEQEAWKLHNIKMCVQHHNILLRYFEEFQKNYSVIILTISSSSGFMLCTLAYLLTDPNNSYERIFALGAVLVPELCISLLCCWYGQKIIDESSRISEKVYGTEWYVEPLKFQKLLLIILIQTKNPLKLTGLGIFTFSFRGQMEILQASYSYFNMLVALRGTTF